MKPRLLAVFFICSSYLTFGQKQDSSWFEIGINTVPLFRSFYAPDAASEGRISPFMFTLEKSFGKVGIRTGFGANSIKQTEQPGNSNGNTEFIKDSSTFDMRLGLVFYKNIDTKWSFRFGIDGRIGNNKGLSNTSFTDSQGVKVETINENKTNRIGVSPFVFFQYHLSKHISLGSELSYTYLTTSSQLKQENTSLPDFNAVIDKTGRISRFDAPSALFLIVRF